MVTYNYRNNLVLRVALSPFFNLQCALTVIHGRGRAAFPLLCIIVNTNQRTRNGAGLGTRLY